jgi:hypothetical protein
MGVIGDGCLKGALWRILDVLGETGGGVSTCEDWCNVLPVSRVVWV